MTLLHRTPEAIERMRAQIGQEFPGSFASVQDYHSALRRINTPESPDNFSLEVHEIALQDVVHGALHTIMDSSLTGNVLNQMDWSVVVINRANFPLLASDRPIVMTNGIGRANSYLILPISPRHAFVGAGSQPVAAAIAKFDRDGKLSPMLDDRVVRQTRRYVWGTDDTQLKFVEKRLGLKARWSAWEWAVSYSPGSRMGEVGYAAELSWGNARRAGSAAVDSSGRRSGLILARLTLP